MGSHGIDANRTVTVDAASVLKRFQEKWKHFSGSETRQDKDLEPFGDSVKP